MKAVEAMKPYLFAKIAIKSNLETVKKHLSKALKICGHCLAKKFSTGPNCDRASTSKKDTENLVYVRYHDHILFRNADPDLYRSNVRETVGWILKENNEAIWILWDRSVEKLPYERVRPQESGLVILKGVILEIRRIA